MLDTKYNHIEVEKNKYENWKEKGYFKCGDKTKKPYSIVIPPPNVTGKLHLGHAWNTTIQDAITRYKRMDNYDVLWLPGMDHAGIATQAKVDARLRDNGVDPRSLGRESWLKHAFDWKEEYANNIHNQWAKMGLGLDYSKERFTLDEGLSKAVTKVFIDLYNKGLIYRGERIINWDPKQRTALSNEEVIYKDVEGAFYHIKYMVKDSDKFIEVATTRPETLFGDTAVAVNAEDERYKDLIGKNVILPLINKEIPIITDEHADPTIGTGAVKITPAHDPNDFEVGMRHNLEKIIVMNEDGTMNEKASVYNKMTSQDARKKIIEDLEKEGLLIKVEKMIHSVGHSERSGAVVEPRLSKQWFVKMRPLADRVLANQKSENKVNFVPTHFEKTMNHWMEITYDWCISRQLWWGHQIPAYYKDGEVFVGESKPDDTWVQDNDVLDTWFSSALWPFSTLGWPEKTEELSRYYPNNVLVTGYDIIPFWVNRMTFQGLEFTDKTPFKDCLIHGLIRDKQGRKMSKSLGNGVDPMDVIEKYGCDSLRYFLVTSAAPGTDLRYDEEKVKSTWNFVNKLWNASRFVLMNLEGFSKENYTLDNLSVSDKWILNKLNNLISTVRKHMDKYEFNIVGTELYSFIWNDYCDWYIELSKGDMSNTNKSVLLKVLTDILKLLHPFMPYVTEEIYSMLPIHGESIMIDSYPIYEEKFSFETNMEDIINFVTKVRTFKLDNSIPKDAKVWLNDNDKDIISNILRIKEENLTENIDGVEVVSSCLKYKIIFIFDNTQNKEKELDNLIKAKEKLENSIKRRKALLSNENYVNKAPQQVVENDKNALLKEENELISIMEKYKTMV